jgi:hypothetical protein
MGQWAQYIFNFFYFSLAHYKPIRLMGSTVITVFSGRLTFVEFEDAHFILVLRWCILTGFLCQSHSKYITSIDDKRI